MGNPGGGSISLATLCCCWGCGNWKLVISGGLVGLMMVARFVDEQLEEAEAEMEEGGDGGVEPMVDVCWLPMIADIIDGDV